MPNIPKWDDTVEVQVPKSHSGAPKWEETTDVATPGISQTESALRGAGQGATFGLGDEASGGMEAQMGAIEALLTGENAFGDQGRLEGIKNFVDNYRRARDTHRGQNSAAEAANPKTYMAGEVGGGIIGSGPFAASEGALTGGRLGLKGLAMAGAKLGAAGGFGASKTDLTQADPSQYLQAADDVAGGALNGAVLGPAVDLGLSGGSKALSALGKKLAYMANESRVGALGGGKAQMKKLLAQDKIQELGQYLKDENAMGPFTTRNRISENIDNSQSKYGGQIGDIIKQSDLLNLEQAAPKPVEGVIRRSRVVPEGSLPEAPTFGGQTNVDYLNYNPENTTAHVEPWERATGLGAGSNDPVTFVNQNGPTILPVEKTAVPKLADRFIDPAEFVNEAKAAVADPLSKNSFTRRAGEAINNDLDHLQSQYKPGEYMSFDDAQKYLKSIRDEKGVYQSKNEKAATGGYEDLYQLLRNKEKDAIGAVGTSEHLNLKEPFDIASRKYHLGSLADDAISGKLASEQANRFISPTDYLASTAGFIKGGKAGAAALGAANHIGRKFWNQASASVYDKLGSELGADANSLNTLRKYILPSSSNLDVYNLLREISNNKGNSK